MKKAHRKFLGYAAGAYGVLIAGAAVFGGAAASPAPISKAELGRLLFWDPILSGGKDIACATCHHPDFAYADGRAVSLGTGSIGLGPARVDQSGGQIPIVRRNSPTVLNTVFNGLDRTARGGGGRGGRGGGRNGADFAALPDPATVSQTRAPMFWDNRATSLEAQALAPVAAHEEMRGNAYSSEEAVNEVLRRLRGNPEYTAHFRAVYGTAAPIDSTQLADAIAAFERTLVARNSPFDRHLAGDPNALTPQQLRGMNTFDRVNCTDCHRGPMLSDFDLHALGVREHPGLSTPDSGDGRFRFRTPSLRNVALTAPYMHNGMLATLDEVLVHYDRGRSENPNVANGGGRGGRGGGGRGGPNPANPNAAGTLDGDFRDVGQINFNDRQDIIAFLHALTDPSFDRTIPARVPSGLPVGGAIAPARR